MLHGDGIATVDFGQSETSAIRDLEHILGPPSSSAPLDRAGNCDIDAAMQWPMITAFFDNTQFVGYSTLAANGERLASGNLVTAKGLRIGDSLAQAEQLYGSALTTSLAQGGSWFASTSRGKLMGYLTAEPNQTRYASAIASIEAGSVGCPAVTP